MTREKLLTAGLILINGSAFWIAIITDYFQYKGLSIQQGLSYIAYYQLLVVILEFPTGIIGDKFGHRTSVVLGAITTCIGLILLTIIPTNNYLIYIALSINALGISLVSGSDMSLLSNSSSNFRLSNSNYSTYGLALQIIVISLGSFFYKFYPNLPFILTVIFISIGIILVQLNSNNLLLLGKSNIYKIGRNSIKSVIKNKSLILILLSSSFLVASFGPLKWITSTIFKEGGIDTVYWGILFTMFFIGRLIGAKLSIRINKVNTKYFSFGLFLFFILSLIVQNVFLVYLSLLLMSICYGVLEVEFNYYLNETLDVKFKSSINSLKSLLARLASSGIIYLIGLFTGIFSYRAGLIFLSFSAFITFFTFFLYRRTIRECFDNKKV